MSVLLIGLDSDTCTSQFRRNKFKDINKKRAYHIKQENYRRELDLQVQQKSIRRSKERQMEKWTEVKLQDLYNRQLWRLRHKKQTHQLDKGYPRIAQSRYEAAAYKSEDMQTKNANQVDQIDIKLPPINNYSTTYINSYGTPSEIHPRRDTNLPPGNSFSTPKKHSRIKTDISTGEYYKPQRIKTESIDPYSHEIQYQDPEVGLNRLKRFEDEKINEVYRMLTDSVDILGGSSRNLEDSSPYKQLNHRRYLSSSAEFPDSNLQSDYYQLPYSSKHVSLQESKANAEQRAWRAWYARQKLEELHCYLKRQKIHDEIENNFLRDSRSLHTPTFISET